MSGTAAFPFVPMTPSRPQQPSDGHSRLAAAIAGQQPNFGGSSNAGSQFAGPLLELLRDMNKSGDKTAKPADPAYRREGFAGQGSDLLSGQQWNNVLQGYQWDGMPGQNGLAQALGTDLNGYTKQATANAANMGGGYGGGGVY